MFDFYTHQLPLAYIWTAIVVAVWVYAWKAIALWHAARNGSRGWFVILLIDNSISILEIIYVLFVARKNPRKFLEK